MVGSEVVKRLPAQGVKVRAVTRDPRKAEANQLPNVHFVQGDFDNADSIRRACSGVNRAFLLTNSTERTERQTDRLRARSSTERRAAYRESLTVARRRESAGAFSSLSRGG